MVGNKIAQFFFLLLFLFASFASYAKTTSKVFRPPLHLKWVTKLKKEKLVTRRPYQLASPVVSDNYIYIGTASGHLYALTSRKGNKIWDITLRGGIYSEPAIFGSNVYAADRKGNVYSISKNTGAIEWISETGIENSSKPSVTEDLVYIAAASMQIIALDRTSGAKKWQTTKTGRLPSMTIKGSSSPVLYDGNIIVGFADGTLNSYSAKDGSLIWAKQLSDKNAQFIDIDSTPLIMDGVVYLSSVDNQTVAIDPGDGRIIWSINKGGANDIVSDDKRIYISGGGMLSCLDKENGHLIWEQDFEELEISTPAIKDNVIVIASTDDKVYAVSAETGDVKYRRYLGKGSFGKPLIVDNTLFLLTNSSRMFALKGR